MDYNKILLIINDNQNIIPISYSPKSKFKYMKQSKIHRNKKIHFNTDYCDSKIVKDAADTIVSQQIATPSESQKEKLEVISMHDMKD